MNHSSNIPLQGRKNRQVVIEENGHTDKPSIGKVLITKLKARKQAGKIVKALKEVKDFESGKKQPTSFDEFLKEL